MSNRLIFDPRVYFVRDNKAGLVKIGYSSFLAQRIESLRVGGRDLSLIATVLGGVADEHFIHRLVARYSCGGEWFRIDMYQINEAIAVLRMIRRRSPLRIYDRLPLQEIGLPLLDRSYRRRIGLPSLLGEINASPRQ